MGAYFPDWIKKMMGGIMGVVAVILGLILAFFILISLLRTCAEIAR